MDCNITVYRKDYIPIQVPSVKELKANIEKNKSKNIIQRDPIGDSFKHYLHVNGDGGANSEEVNTYFERAKETYPWLAKVTENKPVDKAMVQKNKIFEGRTLYQVDYCDLKKDNAYKEYMKRTALRLPSDVEIPLTAQKSGYRNPKVLNSRVYEKSVQPRPPNNLVVNHELREILHVTTGHTEYTEKIARVGEQIMDEELHGIRA